MQNKQKKQDEGEKSSSMVEDFQRYFDIDLATGEEMKHQTYGIRYRVYCEEFNYEPTENNPGQVETDEFDDQSLHCLITHKASGMPAGCVRVVCVNGDEVLPMEAHCAPAIDQEFLRALNLPRNRIVEISRLAVDGAFRRRSGEHLSRFGALTALDCSQRELRTFSLIAISSLLAGFAVSDLIGRPNCLAMMEPFLPRMLRRSGVHVKQAGSEIDYHGTRAPYFSTVPDAVRGMPDDLSDLYSAIRAKFAAEVSGLDKHWVLRLEDQLQSAPARVA